MRATISIVIATYNRAGVVGRAIASALRQEDPIEVVLVDDGSTDGTGDVVQAIDDSRLRYVRVDHGGHTRARNEGARAGTGALLAFLDDDDELDATWATEMRAPFADDGVVLVCCGARQIEPGGHVVAKLPYELGAAYDGVRGRFDTGSYVVRRSLFEAAGGFTDGLPASPHNELAFRLLDVPRRGSDAIVAIDHALVTVHQEPPRTRARNQPQLLHDAATYIIEHHRDRLERDPRQLANHLAIAAICAARLDDFVTARRLLSDALHTDRRVKHVVRYAIACMPALGRRVWHTREWRGSASTPP